MADNRPIGIFDSGLGGLTVVREIMKLMPNESIVYFGDTGRVPYGTRSAQTIKEYAAEDEKILLGQGVKLIIAACGTVSSVAADTGAELPVPFFEVVTAAAKEAARVSKTGRIGVIGTGATIRSSAHRKVILSCREDAVVAENACTLFVPLVEEGWFEADDEIVLKTAQRYLAPIKEAEVDTLILGCTHYPILSEAISAVMGDGVTLINMGKTAAQEVRDYMQANGLLADEENQKTVKYLVSDKTEAFRSVASTLLGEQIDTDKVIKVDVGQ